MYGHVEICSHWLSSSWCMVMLIYCRTNLSTHRSIVTQMYGHTDISWHWCIATLTYGYTDLLSCWCIVCTKLDHQLDYVSFRWYEFCLDAFISELTLIEYLYSVINIFCIITLLALLSCESQIFSLFYFDWTDWCFSLTQYFLFCSLAILRYFYFNL